MKRLLPWIAVLCLASACAIPLPRSDDDVSRPAVDDQTAHDVFERYMAVHDTAVELSDAKPLSVVEADPLLAIDAGSFEVSGPESGPESGSGEARLAETHIPRFAKYPMWFVARITGPGDDVERVAVFTRRASTEPWQMVASPQVLADTTLPPPREIDGALATVRSDSDSGLSMSPQEAADVYARALDDPDSQAAKQIGKDGFIKQMRQTSKAESGLKNTEFTQAWKALEVRHAARTQDGGAMAWITLSRKDTYRVKSGLKVTWPKGSPQQAFLGEGITGDGTLQFYHQLLLFIPADGAPRALGQYGGVVGADPVAGSGDDDGQGKQKAAQENGGASR